MHCSDDRFGTRVSSSSRDRTTSSDSSCFEQTCGHVKWWGKTGGTEQRGSPLILQTKHKHVFKLHLICQLGQFILRKITEIVATRSHLLKLTCTKFDFSWVPDSAADGGAHSAPTDLPGWILGDPASKGKEGRGRGEDREREEKGKKRNKERGTKGEREKKGKRDDAPSTTPLSAGQCFRVPKGS